MFSAYKISILISIFAILTSCSNTSKKASSSNNEATDKVKIEYIAHASFLLSYEDHTLLLDPYADSVWISYLFPKAIEADAIFSTHPHYDHDGGIFRNLNPYWQGSIPFYQDPGDYTIGDFKIQGIKGKHCDPYGKEFGQKNTIFIFEVGGLRIAHWGDNEPLNDATAAALIDIDILMLPIDDTFHIISSEDTKKAIQSIDPKIVIPMHYKITELESTPDKPKNLGPIDAYIAARNNVTLLESNTFKIGQNDLPKQMEYLVFKHSPKVQLPDYN